MTMHLLRKIIWRWPAICGLLAMGLFLAGCGTDDPGVYSNNMPGNKLRVGDMVIVGFEGMPSDANMFEHAERIKDDGTITLQYIGAIHAAGKTIGNLQKEIRDRYVPQYFHFLNVTVKCDSQFYYVGGEVKGPGKQDYVAETDIVKAIQAAGDFTDFANKRKVRLVHSDGTQETINVQKALEGDLKYAVPIYPGDKIIVPRKLF